MSAKPISKVGRDTKIIPPEEKINSHPLGSVCGEGFTQEEKDDGKWQSQTRFISRLIDCD